MALAKELQKTLMDSKEIADKVAKAAAALLKSTQVDAAMKAKSKVDAEMAAEAQEQKYSKRQHETFIFHERHHQ